MVAGFAREGVIVQGLPAPELQYFGLEKRGGVAGRLYQVGSEARVALVDRWIQDKSGSYVRKSARLYIREGDQWKYSGGGTAIGDAPAP